MRGHLVESYGPAEVLKLVELPDPESKKDWVLIDVKAFGINRSELYTRQGHSGEAVTIPRVLGIECVGIVVDGGGTDLKQGQKVAAAMGFMGRKYHGGYAEKTLVPRSNVFPVETDLDWEIFGAIPETYLTAWGAAVSTIGLKPGDVLLVRGGSSAAGLATTSIAKHIGCTVFSTTRKEAKRSILNQAGVDHVLIDTGTVEDQVKAIKPAGVNGVVEFVGRKNTIVDCLKSTARHGTVCMVGFLGNEWDYDFFPWMPSQVKLTLYSSETLHADDATPVLQTIVDRVASGDYKANIHKIFDFDQVIEAHQMMEQNQASGKLVIRIN